MESDTCAIAVDVVKSGLNVFSVLTEAVLFLIILINDMMS